MTPRLASASLSLLILATTLETSHAFVPARSLWTIPVPAASPFQSNSKTALDFMGALSDDTLLTHRPLHDISHSMKTWFQDVALPKWMPSPSILKHVAATCYACLGCALIRLALLGGTAWTLAPVGWMIHLLGTTTSAQLAFGMQRLRPALVVQGLLLVSMPIVLWGVVKEDLVAACLLLPYTTWLLFAVVLMQQVCRLNPSDQERCNNAMLQADIRRYRAELIKETD